MNKDMKAQDIKYSIYKNLIYMKAPDKITIHKYNIADDGDVVFAWVTKSPDCEPMQHPVEYIRLDTFIKKTCEWIKNNSHNYANNTLGKEYLVNDFKNYIKGESQ